MAGDDPKSSAPEDTKDIDPYYDPFVDFELFAEEDFPNVTSDISPYLMDVSFTATPIPPPPHPPPTPLPPPTQAMEVNETQLSQETSLSVSDYVTEEDTNFDWDMFNTPKVDLNNNINDNVIGENLGNDNVGASTRLETSNLALGYNKGPNFETGGGSTRPVPVTPPVSDGILLCECCNFLRQLVHSNGPDTVRLYIHGGNEYFCHAILEIKEFGLNEYLQTLRLKDLRREDVIKFIENYCSWKKACGFTLLYDSNSDLYLPFMNRFTINNQPLPPRLDLPLSLSMPNEALGVPIVPQYVGLREESNQKKGKERRQTPLAAQRERTGKLTVQDMSMHFHLPMEEAARRMSVCPTVVKKTCRKGGIDRWPYRKIKSLEKQISSFKSVLCTAKDAEVRARIEEEIERLQKEINDIFSDALNTNIQ